MVWHHGIVTGKIKPDGLKEALYAPFASTPLARSSVLIRDNKPFLTNRHMDLEIGLTMINRALGITYARYDLFAIDELPISEMESSAQYIANGTSLGHIDYFRSTAPLASLAQGLETSAQLIWASGLFIERELPIRFAEEFQKLLKSASASHSESTLTPKTPAPSGPPSHDQPSPPTWSPPPQQ